MVQKLANLVILAILGVGTYVAFTYVRQQERAEEYRSRLEALDRDHKKLREVYNEAVRQTTVTELLVEDRRIYVVIRTAEGELKRILTPYNPADEIYVDFVVMNGRLWIRRVFDAHTSPNAGTLVDPALGTVDWNSPNMRHGKAIYRQLGQGRWVISVSGSGALDLTRPDPSAEVLLSPPPQIVDYLEVK